MRYFFIFIVAIMISGCQSLPVQRNFPSLPVELSEFCEELGEIHDNAKLSDVAKSVTNNYQLYHMCSLKHKSLVDWYNQQKSVFESVK